MSMSVRKQGGRRSVEGERGPCLLSLQISTLISVFVGHCLLCYYTILYFTVVIIFETGLLCVTLVVLELAL